jgi:hypothetical protein
MDVRVTPPQQAIGVRLDGLIAFASGFLQALQIEDADMTTTVAQEAGLLQRVCEMSQQIVIDLSDSEHSGPTIVYARSYRFFAAYVRHRTDKVPDLD